MNQEKIENPEIESVRKAMELAWKDHHHARDQTWKTVQIVAVIAAGLVTIDYQYKEILPTLCASILVAIAGVFGILITWNHRKLEKRKFIHIMNYEEYLKLHQDYLIPLDPKTKLVKTKLKEEILNKNEKSIQKLIEDSSVKIPEKFKLIDIINPGKNNTALFILRMHLTIILFSVLVLCLRILK